MLLNRLFSVVALASIMAPIIAQPLPRPDGFEGELNVWGLEAEVEKDKNGLEVEIENEDNKHLPSFEVEAEIKNKKPSSGND
ncbi:unnamed protein product [Rhizoctonia solani]|uniref:Uncharacterized protein n=1 Tax=Rhizoctonia solani TaxID=456999 RepID=A0A8H3G9H6_9AGAM|nr:unnamed protein product [Rhizoctonia solani]